MKLFDKNEKYIGNLQYVLEAKHVEEINGEDILTITTVDNRVEKGFRIVYRDKEGNWKEFIIKGIEEIKQPDGIIKSVYCESSFYETLGDYIEDKRPYNTTANIALERALEPTRWEVGIVDDLGINSVNFYHISAKEAVQKVAETWKGEIRTRVEVSGNRIVKRYVDLLARRGNDTGKRFTYTKDIEEIKKIVHRDDVITALYGYGKGEEIEETGGYGRRITFGDINGGKNYVENEEARLIWGRNNPDGTKSHVFGKVEFDDVEDPEELLRLTKEKLEELSKPLITYECKVIDLKAYGFEHEGVELGDTVVVIDKDFEPELRVKARVISITRDLLEPENNEIILGNFIPSIIDDTVKDKEFINNFRGKQGVWDRSNIISPDLKISANYLDEIINRLNDDLNSRGGYVYLSEDGKGIITYDKPIEQDPTKAIQITGGAFRIANSKLPNGEWNWRTFGTGDGFVADLITAGKLKGGKVAFDLTNGTLLIGNNTEDYNLYFDGNNLSIKLSNNKSIETALTELETGLQDYTNQKTQEAIDNIEIGGRNLLHNTSDEWTELELSESDYFAQFVHPEVILEVGKTYVFSVIIEKVSDDDAPINIHLGTGTTSYEKDIHEWRLNNIPFGEKISLVYTIQEEDLGEHAGIFAWRIRNEQQATTVRFKEVKLEKGNKPTGWTPAPEDVDVQFEQLSQELSDSIEIINTEYTSLIEQRAGELEVALTQLITNSNDEIVSMLRSEIDVTAESLSLIFTELEGTLGETNAEINEIKSYFDFGIDGLGIGRFDNPIKLHLGNDRVEFRDSGTPVAWFTDQTQFVKTLEVVESVRVGNHIIEKFDNEITIVRWTG